MNPACTERVLSQMGRTKRSNRHSISEAELRSPKDDRKAKQLCRQVAETLECVLSGECRDELLQCLHVVSVVPAPNSSRLLVTVAADTEEDVFNLVEITAQLSQHTGRLRAEIASSINRKRVPSLVFHVLGPQTRSQLGERGEVGEA